MVALKAWRGPVGVLLLMLLLFSTSLGAAEDFLAAYKEGLAALENRQWDLAAEKMREALEGRSEESGKLVKKGYWRKYLPHYFLGVALYELGDCEGALESWAESERQGVVTRRKIYDDLVRSRERCEIQTRLADQISPLERQLARMEAEVGQAAGLKRDRELQAGWNTGSPSLAQRHSRTREQLQQARARLDEAESEANLDLLPEVENFLTEARREWKAFEQQAEAQRARMRSTRVVEEKGSLERDAGQELARLIQNVERLLEEMDQKGPRSPELQELQADLARLTEQAKEQAKVAQAAELERLLADLERSRQSLERALDPPPEELDLAVEVFLQGDYPQVVEVLAGFSAEEQRAMAHAHLLRAAALFALHRIRGEAELLKQARKEARAALFAEPELTLPGRFFSPRFRELFQVLNGSDQGD